MFRQRFISFKNRGGQFPQFPNDLCLVVEYDHVLILTQLFLMVEYDHVLFIFCSFDLASFGIFLIRIGVTLGSQELRPLKVERSHDLVFIGHQSVRCLNQSKRGT